MKLEDREKRGESVPGTCMDRYMGGCGSCVPSEPSGFWGTGWVGSGGTCQKSCWPKNSPASVTWYVESCSRWALK